MKILLIVILAGIIFLAIMSFVSKRPTNLGVIDGRLAPPPHSPNCVSSFADPNDAEHYIEASILDKTKNDKMADIKKILSEWPRTEIISETENYLHVECTTLLFRFTDDLEILIDEDNKQIHFRSASRVGYSDFGTNRKRVIKLKEQI